jgi:4a-hydroxytetrahydrobiopterin dehydratase
LPPAAGSEHRLDLAQAFSLADQPAGLADWSTEGRTAEGVRLCQLRSDLLFVNTVAGLAERENHHPDLEVGYGRVKVSYSTHDVGGLSRNDFICAAKIEALAQI